MCFDWKIYSVFEKKKKKKFETTNQKMCMRYMAHINCVVHGINMMIFGFTKERKKKENL